MVAPSVRSEALSWAASLLVGDVPVSTTETGQRVEVAPAGPRPGGVDEGDLEGGAAAPPSPSATR